jgi:DNA-binding Lrp family transcriptional regulator
MDKHYGLLLMSHKERERVSVLGQILDGRISQVIASQKLDVSPRHISRMLQRYKQDGASTIISKQRGARSNRTLIPAFKETVMAIVKAKYPDFGPTFASEKLLELDHLKISKETLRNWMIGAGLRTETHRKKKRIHQQRQRRLHMGELVQIDGSFHDWFEGRADSCCLIVFIDDATSKLLALRFVPRETTQAYFTTAKSYFENYGRPIAFYSDKHSIFRINTPEAEKSTGKTQFGRAMAELGIELICAHSPQAKGRVERANGTLQDRLIKELRLANISCIEEANAFVPAFIEKHNQRFATLPALEGDAHRHDMPDDDTLNLIFSHQEDRVLSKNLELSYKNNIYQIQSDTQSYTMRKSVVKVCDSACGNITILYKGHSLDFKVFDKNNRPKSIVDAKEINPVLNKIVKVHKPKADHPWKKYAKIAVAKKAGKSVASPHIPTGSTGLYAEMNGS